MGKARLAALLVLALHGVARAGDHYEIKSFRWEEDYSYLARSAHEPSALESLKFVALSPARDMWLTLGADTRVRADLIENSAFSLRPGGDYQTLTTRLLFHTDWHLAPATRVFLQLGYHDENGRRPRARSFDEGGIDVEQAFVDVGLVDGWRVRAGRQELPLGNQRLADVREGGNIRRSFDGVRVDGTIGAASLIGFAVSPILNADGDFDDAPADGEAVYGLYASAPIAIGSTADIFWLQREKPNAVFSAGTADDTRATVGGRFSGTVGGWDYDLEAIYQFGSFGDDNVRAYAASLDLGWKAKAWGWQPRFGVRLDLGSGDRQTGDGELNTFDGPYPNFSYLSATSAYWPGNAWSVFPLLTVTPDETLTYYLGAQYMARLETADGFYYQPQTPIALPGTTAHGVMTQAYTRLRWQPTQHWSLTATAIYQAAGLATNAAGGEDTVIGSTSIAWRF